MKWFSLFPRSQGYDGSDITDLVIQKTIALGCRPVAETIPAEALVPTVTALKEPGDRVLDFGGAAGLHYMVASQAYPDRAFRWAVVEHPVMVERAKHFETENLKFF